MANATPTALPQDGAPDHAPAATRRDFLYIATATVGAVGAAAALVPLIAQMNPDASTLAAVIAGSPQAACRRGAGWPAEARAEAKSVDHTIDSVEPHKCANSETRLLAFPGIEFVLSMNSDKLN